MTMIFLKLERLSPPLYCNCVEKKDEHSIHNFSAVLQNETHTALKQHEGE